jgi:hypothetical protein
MIISVKEIDLGQPQSSESTISLPSVIVGNGDHTLFSVDHLQIRARHQNPRELAILENKALHPIIHPSSFSPPRRSAPPQTTSSTLFRWFSEKGANTNVISRVWGFGNNTNRACQGVLKRQRGHRLAANVKLSTRVACP